jgi:site-specific recombinase XerC
MNKFDGYEFIRKTGHNEVDIEKTKFFETILKEKQLSEDTLDKYMKQIESLIEAKSKSYKSLDINKLDKNFDFIKYIINHACN